MSYQSDYVEQVIETIGNPFPSLDSYSEHIVDLPILCYKSQNPLSGSTLSIGYTAKASFLELFALERYIHAFAGHTEVRDMEHFVQVIAQECQQALQVPVSIEANIRYNGLAMGQRIKVVSS